MRFATSPYERADAIAALTLVRALSHHLIEARVLSAEELDMVREDALEELATGSGPVIEAARKMIEREYP